MSAQPRLRESVLTRDGYDSLQEELAALTVAGRARVAAELRGLT
jgi:hypothetical protein